MLYLTGTMMSCVDLAHYGVSLADDLGGTRFAYQSNSVKDFALRSFFTDATILHVESDLGT